MAALGLLDCKIKVQAQRCEPYSCWVYRQRTSAEFDAELQRLTQVFVACRDAFFATCDNFHWAPGDGSQAAVDASHLPFPDPAIVKPQGESGHRRVAETLQTFIMVASHHLGGLAALHSQAEVLFSPSMLVRAVVENCAHAVWVLGEQGPGDDPAAAAEKRLARSYLEDLLSAEEGKKNAGRMGGKTSQTYLDAKADYDELKAEILTRFPGTTAADLGYRTLLGETLPRLEDCVVAMYDKFHRTLGSTIESEAAKGAYGFLSNMTHPTLYPARQLRVWVTDDAHPGHLTSNLTVDADFLRQQASAAVIAFYNTLAIVTNHFGWLGPIMGELTKHIDAAFPESLA